MLKLKRRRETDPNLSRLAHMEIVFKALGAVQGCLEVELDGTIITANKPFLAWYGYTLEEIVGRNHDIFLLPEDRTPEAKRAFWDDIGRGVPVSGAFKRLGKGGRELIFYATYHPLAGPDGKTAKAALWGTDFTAIQTAKDKAEAQRDAEEQAKAQAFAALGRTLAALAQGDLTYDLDDKLPEQFAPLQADLERAIAQLREALGHVRERADTMFAGVHEIVRAGDNFSHRSAHQATTLQQTATALKDVTGKVAQTAEGARASAQIVSAAKLEAQASGEVVSRAIEAMSQIEMSSSQIRQIVAVIDELALQTNLLALNAGVEAARAGDGGKGFAVVASEVRGLAQRSAEAAKEVKALIAASSSHVVKGSALVASAGGALEAIITKVAEIDSLVGGISTAAQEQATGLAQVNTAVEQMDMVTQNNASAVRGTTTAGRALVDKAEQLVGLVGRFRVGA
ncbi:MAG TPA: methyl-accepting chemotaxis protein [Phenylobacterium sp.]